MVKIANHLGGDALPVYVANNPFDIALGIVWGHSRIHKFGANGEVGPDIEDIWATGGIYDWPQTAMALEAISDSPDDAAGGSGAHIITVQGLDAGFNEIEQDIIMAGTIVTDATMLDFRRTNRAFVKEAGAYASTANGSNAGTITIREAGGGNIQCRIVHVNDLTTNFGMGQTQISRYTVPAGQTATIPSYQMTVEALKVVTFWLWQRQNADIVTSPYAPKRVVNQFDGISDRFISPITTPLGPFLEKTDVWWSGMANAGAKAKVSVDFEIVQILNQVTDG